MGWGELKRLDSKISMKEPNAVGNSKRIYPRTKICGINL